MIWAYVLLSLFAGINADCEGIRRGPLCRKECCSQEEELALLDVVRSKFFEKTTDEIMDKLSHNHPSRMFFDLFYPDTPRYAIPESVEAAVKAGRLSSSEVMDFELTRKMGVTTFSSPACKRTDFIAGFINNTLVRMEKSHAIYQALLVADQIKEEILSFPLSEQCFEYAFKNGLFNSYSCNSCGAGGVFPKVRTCTNLCENIVNGCYYVLTRVFARDFESFKGSLIHLLKERAREERALFRNEVSLVLSAQTISDGVACSGQPAYEVEYRLQRLLAIQKLGRDRSLSNQFRILLRAPEVIVPEFFPIQPNALNFCKHQGHLAGNSDCFNGYSLGDFSGKTLPLSSAGQEKNVFKSFGGTVEDYAKLTSLLDKLTMVTEELRYQGTI